MTLTLQKIYANDLGSEVFAELTCGGDICPRCGTADSYILSTRNVFRCRGCGHQFSWTSGTALSGTKIRKTQLLALAFVFCSNAKGISSIQLAETVGVTQKTAFVLMHKFREVIEAEIDTLTLSGMVEIDGSTFGGHSRLENNLREGFDQRIYHKNFTNRRVIVVARERDGRTVPWVVRRESDATPHIRRVVAQGAIILADQAHAWDSLRQLFELLRVAHDYTFSGNGANTNYAESFWALLRKTHRGVHHKWGVDQMRAYACELAWRQDFRKETVEERTMRLLKLCLQAPRSAKWAKYWQLGKAA